nr:MAG TPA: hypothetical protein [Caudoviricetes sp.]
MDAADVRLPSNQLLKSGGGHRPSPFPYDFHTLHKQLKHAAQ